jgi:hypothetical protein
VAPRAHRGGSRGVVWRSFETESKLITQYGIRDTN